MQNVYLVQMETLPGDKDHNLEHAGELVRGANVEPGGIILFPEMFATGYLPHDPQKDAEDFTSSDSGKTAAFLANLANETRCIVMGAGIAKKEGITNHVSVYAPGQNSEFASYDKIHPFFPEQKDFTAGAEITLFKKDEWIIAPTICYDLRFPETYREAALRGANLITVQAAWPLCRLEHFITLLRARAIENQCYVVAVNACGNDENGAAYAGNSVVLDPEGNVVLNAENRETVLKTELDFPKIKSYRERFPALKDAKVNFSNDIRHRASF